MNAQIVTIASSAVFVSLVLGLIVYKRRPKKLAAKHYVAKWRELQKNCADKKTWPDAVIAADLLLDSALKKRRSKGKTVGARLMAAQHELTDNDGIWAAHNVAKKAVSDPKVKLTKTEVKESLQSYQQALMDLGALRRG